MRSYRVASALANMSAVLCSAATIFWVYLMGSDEYLLWLVALGVSFAAPPLLGVALCRWRASPAAINFLFVSLLYGVWVLVMAWPGGALFWPAALLMLIAAVIRAAVGSPGSLEHVLTTEQVVGRRS